MTSTPTLRLPDPPRPADPSSQLCLQLRLPLEAQAPATCALTGRRLRPGPGAYSSVASATLPVPQGVPCRAVSSLPSHTGYCGHGEGSVPSTSRKRSVPATAPGPFPGQPGQDRDGDGGGEGGSTGHGSHCAWDWGDLAGTGWVGDRAPPRAGKPLAGPALRSCGKGPGGGSLGGV